MSSAEGRDNGEDRGDLVADVFSRMRAMAAAKGRTPPSLQRPPRKNGDFSLDYRRAPVGKRAGEEGQDAATGGDGATAGLAKDVPRDIAGTRIPQHLLHRDGIRLRRWRDRSPSAFGDILAGQMVERGWRTNFAHGTIMARWPELVGDVIAEHTEIVEFKDGIVVVQCSSSNWATQLRLTQAQILRNIAEAVGDGVVEQLKIKGPTGPSWVKGRLRVKGRGPRDTYG